MKEVTISVLFSPGCHVCKLFEEYWRTIEKDWPNVKFRMVSVLDPDGQEMAGKFMILASPGIIINGELWATGGFDKQKLIDKLKELSK